MPHVFTHGNEILLFLANQLVNIVVSCNTCIWSICNQKSNVAQTPILGLPLQVRKMLHVSAKPVTPWGGRELARRIACAQHAVMLVPFYVHNRVHTGALCHIVAMQHHTSVLNHCSLTMRLAFLFLVPTAHRTHAYIQSIT